MDASLLCVYRFRPSVAQAPNFFVRFGTGKVIVNPTKELDSYQKEFSLPFLCSSNARHVVETLKGNAGLEATASAGIPRYNAVATVIFFTVWSYKRKLAVKCNRDLFLCTTCA